MRDARREPAEGDVLVYFPHSTKPLRRVVAEVIRREKVRDSQVAFFDQGNKLKIVRLDTWRDWTVGATTLVRA
jgi:hypothetical protein